MATAVSLLFSPPLANLAELLLVFVFLYSPELRQRLWATWRYPTVKFVLAFYVLILAGLAYSIAPWGTAWSMASGWRKLLLLPVALALFGATSRKEHFLKVLVDVIFVCGVLSCFLWIMGTGGWVAPDEPGVLVRNHATQGMMFAVGAFGAVLLALEQDDPRRRKRFLRMGAVLMVNIALITPGRSGYLVMLVCALVGVTFWVFRGQSFNFRKLLLGCVLLSVVAGGLLIAPSSRDRIAKAISEVRHYDSMERETSMGLRVVFWRNAMELIRQRPLLGYGTGAFGDAYGRLVAGRTSFQGMSSADPHNQYMKIAAEHGLLGLFIVLGMLVSALRQSVGDPWRSLAVGVLLAWCATSMANSHFSTFAEGSFIYLWLGVMLATSGGRSHEST